MVLQAIDELRHTTSDDPLWRESLYWNFNDVERRLGAWIYLWVLPGQAMPSGIIVSFYRGGWPDSAIYTKAMAAPGHRLQQGDSWIYCFQKNGTQLPAGDFDDIEIHGLRLRRLDPLSRYALSFDDGAGNAFEFESRFLTPPFDYADGYNAVPPWLSTNRYHRSHLISGELRIAGERLRIDASGDSDHSWGTRDWSIMGKNLFKMWSFQTADGTLAASLIDQGTSEGSVALGYTSVGGKMASARVVKSSARYDVNGVQSQIEMIVEDDCGRVLRVTCGALHSYIGWRVGAQGEFWGYEGVGTFHIEGVGDVPGATSYFWPSWVTPAALHSGLY